VVLISFADRESWPVWARGFAMLIEESRPYITEPGDREALDQALAMQNLDLTRLPEAQCERIRVGLVAAASALRARLLRSATFDWETTLADHLPTLETYLDRTAQP